MPAPVPGQLRRQVLPVFLALPQQLPRAAWAQTARCRLAPGQGRAGPVHHRDGQVSSGPGSVLSLSRDAVRLQLRSGAGQLGKASAGPDSVCSCLSAWPLAPGAVQVASVQEQPLLKQNNLQKYRYSLCPRPDLAKEEQGSCPGQGLAQPHRAFEGPRAPSSSGQACSKPPGSLSSSSERAFLPWAEVPYQRSAQLPQSHPGPGHVVEWRLSPAEGLQRQCCSLQSCLR